MRTTVNILPNAIALRRQILTEPNSRMPLWLISPEGIEKNGRVTVLLPSVLNGVATESMNGGLSKVGRGAGAAGLMGLQLAQ